MGIRLSPNNPKNNSWRDDYPMTYLTSFSDDRTKARKEQMTDISSMTDEQLNERLAIEVMGWKKAGTFYGYYPPKTYLEPPSFETEVEIKDWQPCTDLNQAVECAEKWKNVAEERNIAIVYTWSGYHIQFRVGNKIVGETKVDDLPRALSEAVLMAVRGEGKG